MIVVEARIDNVKSGANKILLVKILLVWIKTILMRFLKENELIVMIIVIPLRKFRMKRIKALRRVCKIILHNQGQEKEKC